MGNFVLSEMRDITDQIDASLPPNSATPTFCPR